MVPSLRASINLQASEIDLIIHHIYLLKQQSTSSLLQKYLSTSSCFKKQKTCGHYSAKMINVLPNTAFTISRRFGESAIFCWNMYQLPSNIWQNIYISNFRLYFIHIFKSLGTFQLQLQVHPLSPAEWLQKSILKEISHKTTHYPIKLLTIYRYFTSKTGFNRWATWFDKNGGNSIHQSRYRIATSIKPCYFDPSPILVVHTD